MRAMKVVLLLVGLVIATEAAPPYYAQYWQYFIQHAKPPARSEAINPPRDNHQPAETGCVVEDQDKIDCAPGNTHINAELCEEVKCCWFKSDVSGVPWCFYGKVTASQCQTDERVQCGHVEIGQGECEDKGCCWSPSPVRGQPWCFQQIEAAANIPKPESAEDNTNAPPPTKTPPRTTTAGPIAEGCSVEENNMVDCGYYLTTQQECEADGCCWRESDTPGLPWCFYKVTAATQCQVDPAKREECGTTGMKPEQCESAGCCWSPTRVDGSPWCYQEKREKFDLSRVLPNFFGQPE